MTSHFKTIDEYIGQFDENSQQILQDLRQHILSIVPSETTETISYQMPTFRYQGNLIHFALYKNHIGIYPGPDAISHFENRLKNYKTSKGAIQIPRNTDIDKSLIKDLLLFNLEKIHIE